MPRHWLRLPSLNSLAMVVGWSIIALASIEADQEQDRKSLGQNRITAAIKSYDHTFKLFMSGETIEEAVYLWSIRIRESQCDIAQTGQERTEASAAHLARMKSLQKPILDYRGGRVCLDPMQVLAVDYDVKEAEFWAATSLANPLPQVRTLKTLGQSRLAAALAVYEEMFKRCQQGETHPSEVSPWSRRVFECERDAVQTSTERSKAAASHLARMVALQKPILEELLVIKTQGGTKHDLDRSGILAIDYDVKEAEYWAATSSLNPAPQERTLMTLRQNCHAAAVEAYEESSRQFRLGMIDPSSVYLGSRRVFEWERDAAPTASERSKAAASHHARMIPLQTLILDQTHKGEIGPDAVLALDYYVKEAEYWAASPR